MSAIRILVAEAEGSVPRCAGTVMWVWTDAVEGTIGGGALELEAITVARKMLTEALPAWYRELRAYPLGPSLGQCCGGMVRLLYELAPAPRLTSPPPPGGTGLGAGFFSRGRAEEIHAPNLPSKISGEPTALVVRPVLSSIEPTVVTDRRYAADWPIPVLRAVRSILSGERPRATLLLRGTPCWVVEAEPAPPHLLYLYGAGHVGRAVVRAMSDLPFLLQWVDVAVDRFPADIPPNAASVNSADPAAVAATAPPQALHLIMTFSHALDLSITHAVLAKDFAWAGLIGSITKRARFEKRLRESGIDNEAIARLACPIGIVGITGKEPSMIAISVAAQLAAWASPGGTVRDQKGHQHG